MVAIYWQDLIFQMKYASKPTLMKTFSISFKHHDHQKLRRQNNPITIKKDSLYECRVFKDELTKGDVDYLLL